MKSIFPPFSSACSVSVHEPLFAIKRIRQGTVVNPEVVISTSLFWGVTYFHEKLPAVSLETLFSRPLERKGGTWWGQYMRPLLNACNQQLPGNWQRRIYLSADLEFLVDAFPDSVTVVVMAQESPTSIPGMMWRYLPLEEPVLCVARGADNFWIPPRYQQTITVAQIAKVDLVRSPFWMDLAYQKKFHYRPILGSCAARGPLPFVKTATAWIDANKTGALLATYQGLEHTGMYRWDAFGQDEQFLNHWLYHHMAQRKAVVLTDQRADTQDGYYLMDAAYLKACGATEHIFKP